MARDVRIAAGEVRSFVFELADSYEGSTVNIPVTVLRGAAAGPTLLLTGTIHGDELIGVPIMLALRERLNPASLNGTLILLPVVNPFGFQRQTRVLPDQRDLNRYFPGNPRGSLANRIANRIFRNFVLPSDYCIDFHTAASGRANAPHVRADPGSEDARRLAQGFGGMVVLHTAQPGTLRYAATRAGVPAAIFEGGESGRLDADTVEVGVRGVQNLLSSLGMVAGEKPGGGDPMWMRFSPWLRADVGGVVDLAVALGDVVQPNQRLLTIRSTLDGQRADLLAPQSGIVISIARSPVAQPGNAVVRLGIVERAAGEAAPSTAPEDEMPEE
ncbi:MAG: uncharacterized protein QOD06_537 [Candidatus Binatota bacterium]|jgi:predicted deacylase|nr:uncharacterized protein [Candidatus Binatota bacterium]